MTSSDYATIVALLLFLCFLLWMHVNSQRRMRELERQQEEAREKRRLQEQAEYQARLAEWRASQLAAPPSRRFRPSKLTQSFASGISSRASSEDSSSAPDTWMPDTSTTTYNSRSCDDSSSRSSDSGSSSCDSGSFSSSDW